MKLLIILILFCSCSKGWEDIEIEQVPPKMVRVSERYTFEWKLEKTVKQEVYYNLELLKYRDTTIFPRTCPDPHIEIRYYKIL
jgi:hypothetical protein